MLLWIKNCTIAKKPHNPCQNHLLQSEIELMMKNDENLCYIIDTTYGTMLECKSRIKNRAVLCNLTKQKLIICNIACWIGKVDMLSQFCIMHNNLEIALDDNTAFVMNTSIEKSEKMLL